MESETDQSSKTKMESETDQSSKTKMESLRTICDTQFSILQHKLDSFTASFPSSLNSTHAVALDTAQNHAKLAQIKANLREAEDQLVKVLAAKTRKEAKQMSTRDSISAIKARVEQLKTTVQLQRTRRDEYGTIISPQSLGVKFTFNDINIKNPKQEYYFTIRHANDAYSLLDCNPRLNGIKELISELNRTCDLFGFVRIMREKFQEAAALGMSSLYFFHPSCENQIVDGASNKHPKEVAKSDILSPVRQSTRLKELAKSDILSPIVHRFPQRKKVEKQNLLSPVVWQSPRLKAKK